MVLTKCMVTYSCRDGQSFPLKLIGHQHNKHAVSVSTFNRYKSARHSNSEPRNK